MEYVDIVLYLIFAALLVFIIIGLIAGMINIFLLNDNRNYSYLEYKEKLKEKPKPDHTGFIPYTQEWKDQHLKWASEGLCGECGAPSGEEKGICDKCRWS